MNEAFEPRFDHLLDDDHLEEYGRFQQHLGLLEDERRVSAFARAIAARAEGAVVVDVGAGSGVLGILALVHGARHAYLVEPSRKMGAYIDHLARMNGVADRVTRLPSTLEQLPADALPATFDLLVSETLSSCLFGFGSWDALPALAARVPDPKGLIPRRGTLYAALTDRELATRGPAAAGLRALTDAGLRCDLFEHTFRSAGNVYDKGVYLRACADGELRSAPVASFDLASPRPIRLDGAHLVAPASGTAVGLVLAWQVHLSDGPPPITLGSADPALTSWYPLYVPFPAPVRAPSLDVRMVLTRQDAPYPYAFRFWSGDVPLTHTLFW